MTVLPPSEMITSTLRPDRPPGSASKIDAAIKRSGSASPHVIQPAIDAAQVVRKENYLTHIVGKLHQVQVIDRPQERMHKVPGRLLLESEIFMHASAGIDGQDNLKRKLGLALKYGNLLRVVIFREQKLVPGQAGHRGSFVIGNIDEDIHQANVHANGGWLVALAFTGAPLPAHRRMDRRE